MASITKLDISGDQLHFDRENYFSAETARMLELACDDPAVDTDRVLALILHHGLGLPLSLVARLMKTTKNTVAKQVISGKRRVKKRHAHKNARSLF